jgi:predicted anti-sigma-YlaC factor YlaD
MGEARCNWVRVRLPLLAGGELWGAERRRVERHLIGCASCRAQKAAVTSALTALHAASGESPVRPDAPSLWPALARQIQESRRPAPPAPWALGRLWPRLALAAVLLIELGVTAAAWKQEADARAQVADAAYGLPVVTPPVHFTPIAMPAPRPLPLPLPTQVAQSDPVVEDEPPTRYDYALDHGAPMGPDGSDSKTRPSY